MCVIQILFSTTTPSGTSVSAGNGRYRINGSGASWTSFAIADTTNAKTPNITVNGTYELQVNVVNSVGTVSDWSNLTTFTVSENCGTSTSQTPAPCSSTQTYVIFEGHQKLRYTQNCYTIPNFNLPLVQCGTKIRLYVNFSAKGSIAYDVTYDKTFTAIKDYVTVKEWFDAEVVNLGSFGTSYTSAYGFTTNGLQFYVKSHRNGTASRDVNTNVSLEFGV